MKERHLNEMKIVFGFQLFFTLLGFSFVFKSRLRLFP
jgi:hypothetical protein